MTQTLIERLAEFSSRTRLEQVPPEAVSECRRAILDSIGCAAAGVDHPKGIAGIRYAGIVSAGNTEATIIGSSQRGSVLGAAFANGELVNALDMDVITPPGHVTPYVLPGALAIAEVRRSSGADVIVAQAVAHEMSIRFGKALANQRDIVDGKPIAPKVFGNASGIFGATAASSRLLGHSTATTAHALAIAAYISPVNSQVSWFKHLPSSSLKYIYSGMLVQQGLTASYSAEVGHSGDLQVLDDAEYGYAAFIGSPKWEPGHLVSGLGSEWRFPAAMSYKPYPHCRVWQAALDCVMEIVGENGLKPAEIDAIDAYAEAIAVHPVWMNRNITAVQEAQFSMPHGVALAAHMVPPGKAWQEPELVFSPSVLGLMDRVTTHAEPAFVKLLEDDPASRPARVVIRARGKVFTQERRYAKGSPSSDPRSFMTDAELVRKFHHNCEGVLTRDSIERIVDQVMHLERVKDMAPLMQLCEKTTKPR